MPADFRLYNTLSRRVEPFVPLRPGKVSLYVCGMTVYDHAHVGHARAMVVFDTLVRYLRHRGWDVTYVRNYTDVDDKIIRRAHAENVTPMEIAERYIASVQRDCAAFGLLEPDEEPRVSTSMDSIIAMVERLVENGHAYEAGGTVWFSVKSFKDYGALSGQKPDEVVSADEGDSHKRAPQDFALWKAAKPGEPSWESPWGPGRPGWHIECSAMNFDKLGPTIDIHGGGLDLVFPHHENEIAQSVCANHAPYARYWMHNGLLTMTKKTAEGNVSSAKMGKSLGNVFNIADALEAFPAEAMRLYYLQNHYRSPLPWNEDALPEALAMLARLYEAREVAEEMQGDEDPERVAADLGKDALDVLHLCRGFDKRFYGVLDDDLNTAAALGHAFELARAVNRMANAKKARKRGGPIARLAIASLQHLEVLGLLEHDSASFQEQVKAKRLAALGVSREDVDKLIIDRAEARAAKDWARADTIRDELEARRIVVMDGAAGVSWRVRLVEG